MSIVARIRQRLSLDTDDADERERLLIKADTDATVQTDRAIELMTHWDRERAEDLRRLNRTGNIVEGWIVPDRPEGPHQ